METWGTNNLSRHVYFILHSRVDYVHRFNLITTGFSISAIIVKWKTEVEERLEENWKVTLSV